MSRAKPLLALLALGVPAAALVSVAACDDRNVYIYSAARFDPDNACLEDYAALDTLPGEGASARCSARCMTFEGALYVSTVCPPLPAGAEQVPANASECVAALRALTSGTSCTAAAAPAADGASDADPDAGVGTPEDGGGDSQDAAAIRDAGPG